jgi:L-seryl-tRNA(Ser) seleniumtransferase
MVGFTEAAPVAELATLGLPVMVDAGSGLLDETTPWLPNRPPWLRDEPGIRQCIDAGAEVVTFSGDKLLGGPQAGIIVGKQALVDQLRTHPLMRAVRADKITFAVLEATLAEYVAGRSAQTIPVQQMLHASPDEIAARAQSVAETLAASGWQVSLISGWSAVGGGSAPGLQLPTVLLSIARQGESPDQTEAWLRSLDPPVIARIEHDRVVLDLRTVLPNQQELLAHVLCSRTSSHVTS